MDPPSFSFKIISSHRDCLSRQITEALYIEDQGNMNRKTEFGSNHLYRMVVDCSHWEKEKSQERESASRLEHLQNIKKFCGCCIKCERWP